MHWLYIAYLSIYSKCSNVLYKQLQSWQLRDLYRSSATVAQKYLHILIMLPVEETDHTTSGSPPYSLR